ncbi:MAG: hypothetical protein AAB366_02145 [Patescibacteria group bacterium]
MAKRTTKKLHSDDRFNTDFWREQRRKTLIESTGASVRLSGLKITNEEVEKIIDSDKSKKLYQCSECGFHYAEMEWAEKCEAWCRKHKSCNIEITAHAEENKKPGK